MGTILNEIRLGLRQMRKAPAFTIVAVLTLALGIGANTAVFTLLDQALLRSLPVSHPEQLVRLHWTGDAPGHFNSYGGDDTDYFSYPMYRDLRDTNQVLQAVIANSQQNVAVRWNNKPDMASCELVSGNYFEALGVQPALGRLFVPSDEAMNGNLVAVLSFNYWKTHFGSDPTVINQTLFVNTQPFTIVGVAPPGFHSIVAGSVEDVFVPVTAKGIITPRWQDLEDRRSNWLTLSARLKPGVSRQQAEAAMAPLWHSLRAEEFKTFNHKDRWQKRFLDDSRLQLLDGARGFSPLRDQISVPLMVLMGMVGLLVLMACVNVSSLLLVRAAGRAREISVRYAMGAGRWQIVRQLLIEGVILGLFGGALGVAIAPAVSQVLIRRLLGGTATELPFNPNPDLRVLFFAFGLAFLVSLAFSLAPAVHFLKPDLISALKQQTLTASGARLRFRRISVGVQIGLSLLLLVGAGLFVRTLRNLQSVDLGFTADHLLGFNVNPRLAGYQPDQVNALNRRILQTLAALPGVRAVAATDDPDLAHNDDNGNIKIVGYNAHEDEDMQAEQPWVTPQYFTTMQVPLQAGRLFMDDDDLGKASVSIVNASFAQHYFGSPQAALGHVINFGSNEAPDNSTIVGVVGDTKHSGSARSGQAHRVPVAVSVAAAELHYLCRANLAASLRRRKHHPHCHAAVGLQAGTRPATHHGRDDRRRSLQRTPGCPVVRQLRRAGDAAGRHRTLRRAGLFHGAAHARDRHPHGDGRAAQQRGPHGAGGRDVAGGHQHCGDRSRRASVCADDSHPALRGEFVRSGHDAGMHGTGIVVSPCWPPCCRQDGLRPSIP